MSRLTRLLLLGLPLAAGLTAREPGWQELRIGHTPAHTVTLLGEPLLRSKGRGFEKWTYDDGAEVLFHGALVGWTVPASLRLPARSDDIWKKWPGLSYDAAIRRATPPAAPKRSAAKGATPATSVGFEEYLRS